MAFFHQVFNIWGEKFFDFSDDKEVKVIVKDLKLIEISRETSNEHLNGFDQVYI